MDKITGLIYNAFSNVPEDTSWIFDSYSTEGFGSSWENFGYEIIFRLEEIRIGKNVIRELQEVFMDAFGLPRRNYSFEPTFWRVYWNQAGLRASMIHKYEEGLDEVAKRHHIAVRSNGIIIQPRPRGYLQKYIGLNNVGK
jgi:hypothetical protein